MKQVIVEMLDADMRRLEKVAKVRLRKPVELLQEQLKSLAVVKRGGSARGQRKLNVRGRFHEAKLARAKTLDVLFYKPSFTMLRLNSEQKNEGHDAMSFSSTNVPAPAPVSAVIDSPEAARERRLQVLRRTSGLMKMEPDFPKDGLQYQTEVRTEWD